jgi:hypothetical protein
MKWELAHRAVSRPNQHSGRCHSIVRTLGMSMLRASIPEKLGVPPLGHGSQPQNDGGNGPQRRFQAQSAQRSMLWPHACSHGMSMCCVTDVQGCSHNHAGENGAQGCSVHSQQGAVDGVAALRARAS